MNALLISPKDNVAVVTEAILTGNTVEFIQDGKVIVIETQQNIPVYHKIAIQDIAAGEEIVKYGYRIGIATTSIKKGEHVHCHNVISAVKEVV